MPQYLSPALTPRRPTPPEVRPADPDAQPVLFPEPAQLTLADDVAPCRRCGHIRRFHGPTETPPTLVGCYSCPQAAPCDGWRR